MPRHAKLSPVHSKIFEFICSFKSEHDGCSPTIREIGEAVDIQSSSYIRYCLNALEEAGLITRNHSESAGSERGKSRIIQVVGATWTAPVQ